MEREWGLRNGPVVIGPEAIGVMPLNPGVALARGVGGGEVPPSLFLSFRVTCVLDWESSEASRAQRQSSFQ